MFGYILVTIIMIPIYLGWLVALLPFTLFIMAVFASANYSFYLLYRSLKFSILRTLSKLPQIEAIDDGSPIVVFSTLFPNLRLQEGFLNFHEKIRGRKKIGEMLMTAQNSLSLGHQLLVLECYRSNTIEAAYQGKQISQLRVNNPLISKQKVFQELKKLSEAFIKAGHHTGGAFDITLTDKEGIELDMGTKTTRKLNWLGKAIEEKLSKKILANRAILSKALYAAGFTNNQQEWWHWSYGDQSWGNQVNSRIPIYAEVLA